MSDLTSPLLDVDGLTVSYRSGRRTVVAAHDISFHVGRGACVGVVGESGSGKSSVARALMGHAPISAGRVAFDGMPVAGRSRRGALRAHADGLPGPGFVAQPPDADRGPDR